MLLNSCDRSRFIDLSAKCTLSVHRKDGIKDKIGNFPRFRRKGKGHALSLRPELSLIDTSRHQIAIVPNNNRKEIERFVAKGNHRKVF